MQPGEIMLVSCTFWAAACTYKRLKLLVKLLCAYWLQPLNIDGSLSLKKPNLADRYVICSCGSSSKATQQKVTFFVCDAQWYKVLIENVVDLIFCWCTRLFLVLVMVGTALDKLY